MSKEPTKREDLPKAEQGQPQQPDEEVQARRERGASGEPAPEDFNKGEYHGLTPQQIKKIEDARGDKEPSPPPETGMPAEDTPAMGVPPEQPVPPPEEPRSKKNG